MAKKSGGVMWVGGSYEGGWGGFCYYVYYYYYILSVGPAVSV